MLRLIRTSEQEKSRQNYLLDKDLKTPITITAEELANRLHNEIYQGEALHNVENNCPCTSFALYYLGLRESPDSFPLIEETA